MGQKAAQFPAILVKPCRIHLGLIRVFIALIVQIVCFDGKGCRETIPADMERRR